MMMAVEDEAGPGAQKEVRAQAVRQNASAEHRREATAVAAAMKAQQAAGAAGAVAAAAGEDALAPPPGDGERTSGGRGLGVAQGERPSAGKAGVDKGTIYGACMGLKAHAACTPQNTPAPTPPHTPKRTLGPKPGIDKGTTYGACIGPQAAHACNPTTHSHTHPYPYPHPNIHTLGLQARHRQGHHQRCVHGAAGARTHRLRRTPGLASARRLAVVPPWAPAPERPERHPLPTRPAPTPLDPSPTRRRARATPPSTPTLPHPAPGRAPRPPPDTPPLPLVPAPPGGVFGPAVCPDLLKQAATAMPATQAID